jgi:hypothetical protein
MTRPPPERPPRSRALSAFSTYHQRVKYKQVLDFCFVMIKLLGKKTKEVADEESIHPPSKPESRHQLVRGTQVPHPH